MSSFSQSVAIGKRCRRCRHGVARPCSPVHLNSLTKSRPLREELANLSNLMEGPGNTQPGSATRPRESQTRAQNILFVTRPPPHPVVWLVAAPAVEVRGAPGGLPRVGLPAQLALRPGPATRAAPQRRLRHAVRPRLPGCPGHGRWTRAGGRAFLTGRPNPRPAARPPPDSGVGWTRCVERGYSGRALRPPGRHDGARRGVRGGGLGLS